MNYFKSLVLVLLVLFNCNGQSILERITLGNVEFALLDVTLIFSEAKILCQSLDGFPQASLFRPVSVDQMENVQDVIDDTLGVWLGFQQKNISESGNDPLNYGIESDLGLERGQYPWLAGHPHDNEFLTCVRQENNQWTDVSCTRRLGVVCQRQSTELHEISFQKKNYIFSPQSMNKSAADNFCESIPNAKVVGIKSVEENDALYNFLAPFQNGLRVWLSFTRVENIISESEINNFNVDGSFGDDGDTFPWDNQELNSDHDCSTLVLNQGRGDYQWEITDCTEEHPVLCEVALGASVTPLQIEKASISKRAEANNVKYALLDVRASLSEARKLCANVPGFQDGHLAKPFSVAHSSAITSLLASDETVWLDYERRDSLATEDILSEFSTPTSFATEIGKQPWEASKPEANPHRLCIRQSSSGKWSESTCNIKRRVVCQSTNFILTRTSFGLKEYARLKENLPFSEGTDVCENLDEKGFNNARVNLITSMEENEFLGNLFSTDFIRGSLLTLNFDRDRDNLQIFGVRGGFGSDLAKFPWKVDDESPQQRCAHMKKLETEYVWQLGPCTSTIIVLCSREIENEVELPSPPPPMVVQKVLGQNNFLQWALLNQKASFEEARRMCESLPDLPGATLIRPQSNSEKVQVVRLLGGGFNTWVDYRRRNLELDGTEPRSYGLSDNFAIHGKSTPWAGDHPLGDDFNTCVFGINSWRVGSCGIRRTVICQKADRIAAKISFRNKLLILLKGRHSHDTAAVQCSSLADDGITNATLFKAESAGENDFLRDFAVPFESNNFEIWLGYRDSRTERTPIPLRERFGMVSDFGSTANEFPWAVNFPNADNTLACIQVSFSSNGEYVWKNTDCSKDAMVVCETALEGDAGEPTREKLFVLDESATLEEARDLCESLSSVLVQPANYAEALQLFDSLGAGETAWLNYRREVLAQNGDFPESYGVSNSFALNRGEFPWAVDRPVDNDFRPCIAAIAKIGDSGEWVESSCSIKRRVVCQREAGTAVFAFGDREYFLLSERKSRDNADSACRERFNGNLLTLRTVEDADSFMNKIKHFVDETFTCWMDFKAQEKSSDPTDFGVSSFGEIASEFPWRKDFPDENGSECVTFLIESRFDYKWTNAIKCEEKIGVVCERVVQPGIEKNVVDKLAEIIWGIFGGFMLLFVVLAVCGYRSKVTLLKLDKKVARLREEIAVFIAEPEDYL